MGYEMKAIKNTFKIVAIVALAVLGAGLFAPNGAEAAYELGWRQADGAGTASTNVTRDTYMDLVAPATNNMRVIALAHRAGSTSGGGMRLALYSDLVDATPTGATLIEDMQVTHTAGANTWQWWNLTTPFNLTAGQNIGIAWNNNGGGTSYCYSNANGGNTFCNQFWYGNRGVQYTTAFPGTYPAGATTYTYSYSHHLVYVLYPTVTTNPTALDDATAGYTITGDGFEALDEFTAQGQPYNSGRATTSEVWLTQNNSWATPGTKVAQTVPTWTNTSITFTSNFGALTPGSTAYLWVENSDGEHNATGIPVTLNSPFANDVYAGTATATIISNTQINVSMPFTGDFNNDGDCDAEYNTSDTWPGTTATGSPVSGASPRTLAINSGLVAGNTYYVRVTYNDPDGVSGTATQVLGPYYMQIDTVVGSAYGTVDSGSQITVTIPFTGDVDDDGSTLVQYNTSDTWPGTTSCAAVTGSSPRQCVITGLSPATNYYVRITHTDPDGVTGTNPVVLGPIQTDAVPTIPPTVTLITPGNWPTRAGQATLKQKVGVVVNNTDGVGLTLTDVTLNNGYTGWGTVVSTSGTYGPVLPTVSAGTITWDGPFNVPAHSAVSFFCEMGINVGVGTDADYNMTATANSSVFGATQASIPLRWSRRSYASGLYAFMGSDAAPVYCVGEGAPLQGGVAKSFTVTFKAPANSNTNNRYCWSGPSSTTQPTNPAQVVNVAIPAGWTGVTAAATQGIWNGVNVTGNSGAGWNIYGSIAPGQMMGTNCADFTTTLTFNATPPTGLSSSAGYLFQINYGDTVHTRLIEDSSNNCTMTINNTNRAACDLRGGFMVMVEGGDISPPANVSSFTALPSDNVVSLGWTDPTLDEDSSPLTGYDGVIILRNTIPITGVPVAGQEYSVDGVAGPNTIGTSSIEYVGMVSDYVDGNGCIPAQRLENGTTYYYKAFSFDAKFNYSSGNQVSSIPTDSAAPGVAASFVGAPGDRKIVLSWTNPSECDFSGVTIRYSTTAFPTDRTGVADSSLLAGTKLGGTPGAADQFTHQGLVNGTPYYYTIWAHDDEASANWSTGASPGAYVAPVDNVAPGQITDLVVVPGSETAFNLTIEWSSPADSDYDPASGIASDYELRFFDQPITSGNWNQSWKPGGEWLPLPISVGQTQQYVVTGLSPLLDYYFAMRTYDEVGNESLVSNNATGTTLCNEQLTACDQCHQMPPQDGLPGSHPRSTGNIGKHTLPIHAGAGEAEVCNVCHADGQVWDDTLGELIYDFNHQNDQIDINGNNMIGNKAERDSLTGGTFVPYTTTIFEFEGYSTGVGYTQITGYCTETYCHGEGLSSPRWGIDYIVCGEYCHETPPVSGKHVKHYHPGQHYVNFAPNGTQVSGYTNDDGSTGWSGTVVMGDNGPDNGAGGNADGRYATYIESSDSQKTFLLPDGMWYITVGVGDSSLIMLKQTVQVSGDGGSTWVSLIDNFDCRAEKIFDKTVDHPFTVSGNNNMIIKIGNGTDVTRLNFMIINSVPEAPKTNNTILQNTANAYGFNCGKCHTNDGAQLGHTGHVNGSVNPLFQDAEIHFDANSFPKNPVANYTALFDPVSSFLDGQGFRYTVGAQCVNTYCHGTTLNAGGSNTNPTWEGGFIDVGGASLCGACHEAGYADSTPDSNMDTGSHDKHVNRAFANRFDCYKCHNHTVAPKDTETGIIAISDKTHHVNGDVDAVFDPNDNTMKFGRYSTANSNCYNVYCHSNGLLVNNQPYWATTYSEPHWGDTGLACDYCHGTGTGDGHPDYANLSTTPNSHPQHNEANGIGCSTCHYNTTRDNGLSIYTTLQPSLHVNGIRNVSFNPAVTAGSFNNSNLQCNNTYCHGLSAPPTWGQTGINCGSCHGDGLFSPNPGVGNHGIHNNGAYDVSSTIVTNNSDAGNYDFSCRFCHFSRTHGGGQYNPGIQTAEVSFNTIDAVNGYNNSGATYNPGSYVEIDPVSGWEFTDGGCANLKCHSDGAGGAPNNTFFTWTTTDLGGCDGCHSATATDDYKMSSGSHSEHVWADVYRRNCHDCHYQTTFNNLITDKTKHVNGHVEVSMSPSFGGAFDGPSHECSNVFCHSNANPTVWNGPESEWHLIMNWTSINGTTCTTCHSDNHYDAGDGTRTSSQTLSHNHQKHLTDYTGRVGCTNCHNDTAATNTGLQATIPSEHNNGKKDVVFYTTFFNHTGPSNDGTGFWGDWNANNDVHPTVPVGGCIIICHSDGLGGTPLRFANWSSTSYGCGDCHGTNGNLTSGSHTKHVAVNLNACNTCHSGTADGPYGSPTINAAGYSTNHVNGTADAILVTGTWNDGPETCSATGGGCHGSGDSPVWGTVVTCVDCHGTAGTEVEDWTYGNNTTASVNTTEYATSGHGRTTAYPYTGNAAANLACEACHSYGAHGDAANPFRLMSSATAMPSAPDTVCQSCHSTTGSHSLANVGQGNWSWTPKCIDCHDPHGDTGGVSTSQYNGAMMQSQVGIAASSTYGVPTTTEAVDFPTNFADPALNWSSFVTASGTNKGICRVCHTDAGVQYFDRTTFDGTHNSGQGVCTSCHTHDSGFKPSACNACHGYPPEAADNKQDNVGAIGAHDLHVNTLSLGCIDCHNHNGSGAQHNESAVLGGYSSILTPANVDIDLTQAPGYKGASPSYNGTVGGWSTSKTCSDIGCHYGESKDWDCP